MRSGRLPFGKGRTFLSNGGPATQAILGGWQLSGIYRWNTGLPTLSPYDDARWATNWNVQANTTPTSPVQVARAGLQMAIPSCSEPAATDEVYQASAMPILGKLGHVII